MKTLLKIYFHKIHFRYLACILLSILSLCVWVNTLEFAKRGEGYEMVHWMFFLAGICSPCGLFFVNTYFNKNIDFLINQGFNRQTLIKYYFVSQTIKIFAVGLNYILIFAILEYFSSKDLVSYTLKNYWVNWLWLYVVIILAAFVLYSVGLFTANADKVLLKRKHAQLAAEKHSKRALNAVIPLFGLFTFCFYLDEFLNLPPIILIVLGCWLLVFVSFKIFNRTFRIWNEKERRIKLVLLPLPFLVPFIVFIFLLRSEASDKSLSHELRSPSMIVLGILNKEFDEVDTLKFLQDARGLRYKSVLATLASSVDFKTALSTVNSKKRCGYFLEVYSKKLRGKRLFQTVQYISDLQKQNSWLLDSYLITKNLDIGEVPLVQIEKLLAKNDDFSQFAAMTIAQNSYSKKKYRKFFKNKYKILSPEVQKNLSHYRKIAGEKQE